MAPEKFRQKYRIPSARLVNWDYGSHAQYFVTICTKDRVHYFGNVETHDYASPDSKGDLPDGLQNIYESQNKGMHNGETGNRETHNHVSLGQTTIGKIAHEFWEQIPEHFPFIELDEFVVMPNHVHGILFINKPHKEDWKPNEFGPQSRNLASVLRAYKASVKRQAVIKNRVFEWQPRYYDRVIRNEKELMNIRQYIYDNPAKWTDDMNNPENLYM